VLSPRWFVLVAALSLGCSGEDGDTTDGDAAADVEADSAADTLDATLDGAIDDTFDGTIDDTPGDAAADAFETAPEASPDVVDAFDGTPASDADAGALDTMAMDAASDTAVDTAFTLPTWSPVCVPATSDAATSDAEVGDGADDALADATDAPSDAATDAAADAAPEAGACTGTRLRIVASNLTSGSSPTYDLPGIHILQGLHPDIALMQEFKHSGGLRALVDTAFDPSFRYVTETELGAIPNGIVSRYPILESGEWDDPDLTDRDFVWARIDVPGSTDLFAVSVHLRTTGATARDAEAKNLIAYIKAKVPSGVYLVIGGDFNTSLQTEPALVDFSEIVSVGPPYAVDQSGNSNTNAPRSKPYDWVLPNPMLLARMIPVSIGSASFPAGLVFDTRVYTPLSDVAPAVSTDSVATNMQHMAVVRDFALGD
jgi:hypothetical protein